MKILTLFDDRPDGPGLQDMLLASLGYGLARAFGTTNVEDYFRQPQARGADYAMQSWPVFLGATTRYGMPDGMMLPLGRYDLQFVSTRFLTHAVQEGLCSDFDHHFICEHLVPEKTVLIDSSDDPPIWYADHWRMWFQTPPHLFLARPSNHGPFQADTCEMTAHISVPYEHIWRQMAYGVPPQAVLNPTVFAAMSDNHLLRREVMQRLAEAPPPSSVLRWGSGSGFRIERTLPPIAPPGYYHEMATAGVVVACRGGNRDTLRVWEALALGRALVTDDFGFSGFIGGEHVLYYKTADEMLQQVWRLIADHDLRKNLAKNSHQLYLTRHTPEQQAFRIVQEAIKHV